MSLNSSSAGGQTSRPKYDFGMTHVVQPKGRHEATIVWLHGLGDDGYIWAQVLGSFRVHNVKWVCPTAPTRPISLYFGFPGIAWFDPKDVSDDEDAPSDLEGLKASAAHVADLFSREPFDVKLGIGGFSIGAAAALYTATSYLLDKRANKIRFLDNLTSVIVLSGWLPCYKILKNQLDESILGNVAHIKSLPVLICHGTEDDVVSCEHGERSGYILHSNGFKDLTFRKFDGLCHDTCAQEMVEMCSWLIDKMGLQGW